MCMCHPVFIGTYRKKIVVQITYQYWYKLQRVRHHHDRRIKIDMIAEYQKKASGFLWLGFLVSVLGRVASVSPVTSGNIIEVYCGVAVAMGGGAFFIYGSYLYCIGKGQSPWLCLFGFLGIFGLMVLRCLPDKNKKVIVPLGHQSLPGDWPPPPDVNAS